LISRERYEKFIDKKNKIEAEMERLDKTYVSPSEEVNGFLDKRNSTRIKSGMKLGELLRRPEISYDALAEIDTGRPDYLKSVSYPVSEGDISSLSGIPAAQQKCSLTLSEGDISSLSGIPAAQQKCPNTAYSKGDISSLLGIPAAQRMCPNTAYSKGDISSLSGMPAAQRMCPLTLYNAIAEQVEIAVKYEGYIKRQMLQVEQFRKLEKRRLPSEVDYGSIHGLRLEARQKLAKIKPESIGQASRISGVSPADISVLLIYMEQLNRKGQTANVNG
jgi:tRNA U34 5-carboxymethylaminomethyl modifying enzyme MnmG/GidA